MNMSNKVQKRSIRKRKNRHRHLKPTRLLLVVIILFAGLLGSLWIVKSTLDRLQNAKIIMLDASFGGDLTGNVGLINEAEYSEKTVSALENLLKGDKRFKVVLTRQSGESLSVENRAKKINRENPALVLNIRANASDDSTKRGMELYANTPSSKNNQNSLLFANAIADEFQNDSNRPPISYYYYTFLKGERYGIHIVDSNDTTDYAENTLSLMEKTNVPVVAVSGIYVTSQDDINQYATEGGYVNAAKKYYRAICKYFGISPNE